MPLSPRLIRRRIKSVTNTRKITKAMELVAASKMRRAVTAVLSSRPYADACWRAVGELAKVTEPTMHPLLAQKKAAGKILVILFTSDRGLCGGFNGQMIKALYNFLGKRRERADFTAIGKKGQNAVARAGRQVVAAFTDLSNNPKITAIRPVADLAVSDFISGKYDAVYLAFTDYRSALAQKPMVKQLLPIVRIDELGEASGKIAGVTASEASAAEELTVTPGLGYEYLFEPSPDTVLSEILPRIVETQIYQAILESSASEHSARMVTMRSATDAASDMIDSLTLAYNQARQAGITREIAEISSGKAALER